MQQSGLFGQRPFASLQAGNHSRQNQLRGCFRPLSKPCRPLLPAALGERPGRTATQEVLPPREPSSGSSPSGSSRPDERGREVRRSSPQPLEALASIEALSSSLGEDLEEVQLFIVRLRDSQHAQPAVDSMAPVAVGKPSGRLYRMRSLMSRLVPQSAKQWLDENLDARLRGLILLNAMTLLMGSNWVVIKESATDMDPWVFTSLRFTLAAAAFLPFLQKGLRSKELRQAGLEVGIWSAAGYITQSMALIYTPASRACLLSTFTVLAVPLLAGLSGAKIKPLVWGCGIAALVGTSLLESGGGAPPNIGDAISILSALFFAVQLFRTEQISRQLPSGSALSLMAVSMGVVALSSSAGAAAVHWEDAAATFGALQQLVVAGLSGAGHNEEAGRSLVELLYTSLCSTDLALLLELLALQSVSSTEAAMVYSMEPVSGAMMAYVFLGDRWGPIGWLGAAVILLASIVTQTQGAFEEGGTAEAVTEGGSSTKERSAEKAD